MLHTTGKHLLQQANLCPKQLLKLISKLVQVEKFEKNAGKNF